MHQIVEVADGKARYDGRSLAEWVPDSVSHLVAACEPLQVILFGAVAGGFIERGLRLLRPEGVLGFIVADRWMHTSTERR